MNIYHTVRAFITICFKFLILLIAAPLRVISDILYAAIEGGDGFQWYWFNPIATYKIIKLNHSDEFHKWTGKRKK